jgi:GTP pyrophosphokinase
MGKRVYPIHLESWLSQVAELRGENNIALLKEAINLYDSKTQALLQKGLGIADILLSLGLDNETLASAIAYPALQVREIHMDSILECLGENSRKMLVDVLQMQSLGKLQYYEKRGSHQLENLRKMLLAMVTDVRAVLITLAERLLQLRLAKNLDTTEQEKLAHETLAVYAPLANRLGVWQLKWEIEDLCLRYSHPDTYKEIAKGISSKRDERETYIKHTIQALTDVLTQAGVKHFSIAGRVKHIYSIYKKMLRKNADLQHIYDMSAIRILLNNIDECYEVLSVLQNHWQHIPEEFDDYITTPKLNGYQSIHTVLIGPENNYLEVQIRTHKMHQASELGVAAHWRYKEGVLQTSNYEAKIALLRQLIEWQKEVVNTESSDTEKPVKDLFDDKIYVFTPLGDIIDLPKGATPLDFAYTIHSEVGHRCRGAKVDGNIVPLVYELQMGQRIEILTAKQANPSRDWLNPHYGYLKSPRARAKVAHWFREKDALLEKHEKEGKEGRETREEKEAKKAFLIKPHLEKPHPEKTHSIPTHTNQTSIPNINIVGINNLLTHIAHCCKPLPGDSVIGYVTRNRGLSIHRRNCSNLVNVVEDNNNRLIEVQWGEKHSAAYSADVLIRVYDRSGLLRDITTLLSNEKINVLGLHTQKATDTPLADIYLTIEISNRQQLQLALEHLRKLPNVIEVRSR